MAKKPQHARINDEYDSIRRRVNDLAIRDRDQALSDLWDGIQEMTEDEVSDMSERLRRDPAIPQDEDKDYDFTSTLEVVGDDLYITPGPDLDPLKIDLDRRGPAPVRSPGNALEAHLKTINWLVGPRGREHIDTIYKEADSKPYRGEPFSERDAMWATMIVILQANSTTYVSREMFDLVNGLSETPYGEDYLHLMDVPDNGGTIIFESSYPEPWLDEADPMRELVRVKGLAYRVVGPDATIKTQVGTVEMVYQAAEARTPVLKALKQYGGLVVIPLYDAGAYLVQKDSWDNLGRPPLLPMKSTVVPFGPMPEYEDHYVAARKVRVFITALFRLMWQKVLPRDPWTPRRHERRQFDRLRKHVLDGETYKVVHLRRYDGGTRYEDRHTQESDGLWRRQACVVRGHVRDQYYPTLGPARLPDGTRNPFSHRRIWIDAHIRGDGVPVLKHNLTAVVR